MQSEPKSNIKNSLKVLIVYPNLPLMLGPSLSIGIFTRVLKTQGYEVDLFDTTAYVGDENYTQRKKVKSLQHRNTNFEHNPGTLDINKMPGDFLEKVLEYKPDLLLFTIVEDPFPKAIRLLDAVQHLKIPHILGGIFPTAAPDKCFEYPSVNLVGLGEGETIISEVAKAVKEGLPLNNIPGTWFRDENGEILKTAQPPLVDINKDIADFSLFDEKRFYRPMGGRIFKTIPVETYRGCPYLCTYCNSPSQLSFSKDNGLGNFLRRKSMENLRTELRGLVDRYDPDFFLFVDDSFLARPPKEIFKFCDMYEEFKVPFWFNTRPETCDAEKLQRLKEVGVYRMAFGLECGNEHYRTRILKRNGPNSSIIRWFDTIADSGIPFNINLIIGFPGETRQLIMETIELAREIKGYDTLTASVFTPYHGTELREVAVKNGWLDEKTICQFTSSTLLNMPPPYATPDEIDGLIRVIPLYCYFPKSEWENIKRAEIDDEKGNELLDYYSDIYKREFLGETQNKQKVALVGGTGCRSNPKDSFQVEVTTMTPEEIQMLTL